jgi:hypothetical protein
MHCESQIIGRAEARVSPGLHSKNSVLKNEKEKEDKSEEIQFIQRMPISI